MDPQIGWFQPEQEGPAKEFWMRIWDSHICSRDHLKLNLHEYGNNFFYKNTENIENIPENYKRMPLNVNNVNHSFNRASTYAMNRFQDALIGKYGGCPWRTGKVYDKNPIHGLHEEINEFYEYMTATREEHELRLRVVNDVKNIILSLWPAAQVEVFGSFKSSLYLPTSDIDIVVIGKWDKLPLKTLQDALLNSGICDPDNVKVLDKASVPIVKFSDRRSDMKVDISFNMNNGVKSVELIKDFCQRFPPLKKLVLVLKQFLLQRDLNEVFHGGISSYSLILMCISFLQLHHFEKNVRLEDNLGVLLIEFLELYGRKFNYLKTAISVKDGGSYITKDQLQREMIDGHRPSILSIEDPLTPGNDIGKGSYGALQVKHAFDYAYIVLTQAIAQNIDSNKSSILGRIIRVTDSVVDYRNRIKVQFPVTAVSSNSTDGSVASLPSTDSDSESSLGRLSDPVTTVINPKSQYQRRGPNNLRHSPPVAGFIRSNTLGHASLHHNNIRKHANHIGAMSLPILNHSFGNGALTGGLNSGYQRHINNDIFLHRYHNRLPHTLPHHPHKRSRYQCNRPKNNSEINLR
ncbi:hypothetical protein PGB90_001359 [Kerria lacca]